MRPLAHRHLLSHLSTRRTSIKMWFRGLPASSQCRISPANKYTMMRSKLALTFGSMVVMCLVSTFAPLRFAATRGQWEGYLAVTEERPWHGRAPPTAGAAQSRKFLDGGGRAPITLRRRESETAPRMARGPGWDIQRIAPIVWYSLNDVNVFLSGEIRHYSRTSASSGRLSPAIFIRLRPVDIKNLDCYSSLGSSPVLDNGLLVALWWVWQIASLWRAASSSGNRSRKAADVNSQRRMLWSAVEWAFLAGCGFAGVSGLCLVAASRQEDLAVWRGAGLLSLLTFAQRFLYLAIRKR